jgi:O-antigen/teichoic acid export membrane protein
LRTRRSILTFISGELSTGVTLAIGFVATPLLLRWLGDERYGAFTAALDWFGYVALLELGLGGALRPLLARALAQREDRQVRLLIADGIRAYMTVTAVMLVAGLCLVALITRLLPVSLGSRSDLRLGCLLGVGGLLMIPLAPFRALLEAEQRGYWVNNALLGQSLLITGCSLALAWAGCGIVGQFAALLIGTIAFHTAVSYEGLRQVSSVIVWRRRGFRRSQAWSEIWNLNSPTFAFNVCGRVGLLTDNILIGAFLSPSLIVPFYITQRLATLGQRELQGIGNASWAALAELHAQGQIEVFNRRVVELTRLIAILAVAGLIPVVSYNNHFVALWVGSQRYGGDPLTVIAAINASMLAIFSLWGWCVNGTGQVREIMPGLVVQTAINFALSVILTLRLGLLGPVLGTLAGFLTISSWYLPWLLHRLFGTSLVELIMAVVVPVISAIPFALIVRWLCHTFPAHGWIELAMEMGGSAAAFLGLWWLIGLSAAERVLWLRRAYSLAPGLYQP